MQKSRKKVYKLYSVSILTVLALSSIPTVPVGAIDDENYYNRPEDGCSLIYEETDSSSSSELNSWELVLVNRDNKKSDSDFNITLATVGGIEVDSRIKDKVEQFLAKAQSEINANYKLVSGYRSASYQETVYNGYVEKEMANGGLSRDEAEKIVQTYSQPSGASEHMTGLAIDITYGNGMGEMSASDVAKLEEIGEEFGFIRHFKEKFKSSTGIGEEDWHFRYVGTTHAKAINKADISFEDYIKKLKSEQKSSSSSSKSKSSSSSSSGSSVLSASDLASVGNAGGNWLIEGTKEHQAAQYAFDILTKEKGLSGKSASGWLGNFQSESGFDVNAIEAENGQNYSGRGFGLPQFTPAEKFTNSKYYNPKADLEESIRNQIDFLWDSEFANQVVVTYASNYVNNTYPNIGSSWFDPSDVKIEYFLDSETPEKAMYYFFAGYERGDYYQMHEDRRLKATQLANKMFNTKNVKADPSKWKFSDNALANYTPRIQTASGSEDSQDCEMVSTKKGNGSGFGKDGTGTYKGYSNQAWRPENLPEELRQYAIDPESVGMKWGGNVSPWHQPTPNADGWGSRSDAPTQCTDISYYLGYLLWSDSSGNGLRNGDGNGIDVVPNTVAKFGGKGYSKEPKAGFIGSTGAGDNHTWIVSHTFEDGDVLIIETNVTGVSGFGNGEQGTWSYKYMSKADYTAYAGNGHFDPTEVGFSINPDLTYLD